MENNIFDYDWQWLVIGLFLIFVAAKGFWVLNKYENKKYKDEGK
jgi:uncharacterized protein YneF (UPF0154 family)